MSRERRRLLAFDPEGEEESAEPGRFGCPMLVRSHFRGALADAVPVMRCSLAWALHNEVEVARCRATEVVTDCWKVHPERTPVVVLPVPRSGVGDELETAPAKVAGD